MKPRPAGPVLEAVTFEIDEHVAVCGHWFEISQFGRYTMRLDITTDSHPAKGPQRIPLPGQTVDVKGIEMVVAHVDTEGMIVAVIPPKPGEHRAGATLRPIRVVDHNGEPGAFPVDLPKGVGRDDLQADLLGEIQRLRLAEQKPGS